MTSDMEELSDLIDKSLSVKQLQDILTTMDPELRLRANAVRNLRVSMPEGEYVGYIDFLNGNFEDVREQDQ